MLGRVPAASLPSGTVPSPPVRALPVPSGPVPAVPSWPPRRLRTDVPERLTPDVLGPVAFAALRLDGLVTPVWGDLAVPACSPAGPADRAAALAPLVPARCAVGRLAAAWVHTGVPAPGRVEVLLAPRARRPDPHPLRIPHEVRLAGSEVTVLAGVRVTTAERAALDVARWADPALAVVALHALHAAGVDLGRVLDRLLDLTGAPRVRRALAVVASLQATLRD